MGSENIVIETKLGKIKGTIFTANSKAIYNFNGIRYAVPPIGDRRFLPSLVDDRPWNGTYDAVHPGSKCLQPQLGAERIIEGDEDCLFLNIFTTKSNVENREKALVPVMLWIHGGSYTFGQGAVLNGTNLVS